MEICLKLFISFCKVGLMTFGGGYAMLPFIQREMHKNHWVTEKEILNYYALSQVTPGIIAVNLSTFIGYKLKGWSGAIFALLGVITPSVIVITVLVTSLKNVWQQPMVHAALQGVQLMVPALILSTVYRMARQTASRFFDWIIILIAIVCVLLDVSIFLLLLGCAVLCILLLMGQDQK